MKKKWIIEGIIVFLILIGLYFAIGEIRLEKILYLVQGINWIYVVLGFFAFFMSFAFWNLRIMISLKDKVNGSFFFFLSVLLAGSFLNTITPGARIGGEPLRAHFIGKHYKKSRTGILACLVADKLFHIFVIALFFLFSLFYIAFFARIKSELGIFLWTIVVIMFLIIIVFLYFVFSKNKINLKWIFRHLYKLKLFKKRFKNEDDFYRYFNKKRNYFFSSLRYFVSHKETIFWKFLFSFLYWASLFSSSYLLFLSFGFKPPLISLIVVLSIANVFGEISPTPGGIGVFEGSMFLFFSSFGIPPPLAIVISIGTGLFNYFCSLILGGASLLYLRIKEGI